MRHHCLGLNVCTEGMPVFQPEELKVCGMQAFQLDHTDLECLWMWSQQPLCWIKIALYLIQPKKLPLSLLKSIAYSSSPSRHSYAWADKTLSGASYITFTTNVLPRQLQRKQKDNVSWIVNPVCLYISFLPQPWPSPRSQGKEIAILLTRTVKNTEKQYWYKPP